MATTSAGFIYVPSVKWKQGERIALRYLTPDERAKIKPLINIMPSFIKESTADVSLQYEGPFFCDLYETPDIKRYPNRVVHFFTQVFSSMTYARMNCTPVLKDWYPSDVLARLRGVLRKGNGIAIRIAQINAAHARRIANDYSRFFGIPVSSIDIVLDYGLINDAHASISDLIVERVVNSYFPDARSFILLAGSFPSSIGGGIVDQDSVGEIERKEKIIYNGISSRNKEIIYGDFGCDDPYESPSGAVTIIPAIRYTVDNCWKVARGHINPINRADFQQFHVLSNRIFQSPFFCGESFSYGDKLIAECARRHCTGSDQCNHGNMGSWVQRSQNHHFAFVIRECASRFSPSA